MCAPTEEKNEIENKILPSSGVEAHLCVRPLPLHNQASLGLIMANRGMSIPPTALPTTTMAR